MAIEDKNQGSSVSAEITKDYRNRCSTCLLPETFPGIKFDDDHVCDFCVEYRNKKPGSLSRRRRKWRRDWFERYIEKKRSRRKRGNYDCLLSFSGGKDSTYLLYLLKEEYKLNVLAYTCDTGFMSEVAHRNIENVVAKLEVDHVWRRPGEDFYKRLYSFLLTHPSRKGCVKTVCPQCFHMTSTQALKVAMEMDIPLIAYGFSPAQLRSSLYRIRRTFVIGTTLRDRIRRNRGFKIGLNDDERRQFDISIRHMRKTPDVLLPFQILDYDIRKIKKTIADLGLIPPGDEHPLRTNCLVNLLMIELDSRRLRYHPYTDEFSQLVREGQLDREEWLTLEEKGIEEIENGVFEREKIDSVLERLGLTSYYEKYVSEWK